MVHDGFEMEDDDEVRPIGRLGTGAGLPPMGEAPLAEGPGFFDTEGQLLALSLLGGAGTVGPPRNALVPKKLASSVKSKRRLPAPGNPKRTAAAYLRFVDWTPDPAQVVRLHAGLLDEYQFCRLSDASKLALILLRLFAARCGNLIPDDPEFLTWRLAVDSTVDLAGLVEAGFLEPAPVGERRLTVTQAEEAQTVAAADYPTEPRVGPSPADLLRRFRASRDE